MRIVTWNIHGGKDSRGRPTLTQIINFLRALSPDIVGLQECVRYQGENFMVLTISNALGMDAIWAPTIRDYQSNAVLSRETIGSYSVLRFERSPEEEERRLAIRVSANYRGRGFPFFVTHLSLDEPSRIAQVARLMTWMGKIDDAVLVGDFNDVPGSPAIKGIGLADASPGVRATFPSEDPKERLDYVFIGKKWKVMSYQVPNVLYSDHLPLVVDLEPLRGEVARDRPNTAYGRTSSSTFCPQRFIRDTSSA
ncbi:MAG: endonuclease/exonuclease/phosphatase family protein [Thermoprotei archaeon]